MAANYYSSSRPHTKIRSNLVLTERRPFMQLRDYLLRDDLSSCSSSGFKSFPRRQCCSTIHFLLDKDLKTNPNPRPFSLKQRRSTTLSSLHKALINAVKLLPFPSSSSQKRSLLPRSFSRKIFKKSFWKKSTEREENGGDEIARWRLFKDILKEEQMHHSDTNNNNHNNENNAEVTTRSSSTSTSWSNNVSKSESWGESEFTVGDSQNDAVEVKVEAVDERVAAVVAGNSDQNLAKEWRNEEKEQFSPVSVLDCPFEDDQEDSSSPFKCSLVRIEGTKQKLTKKKRKCDNIGQIEPVDLERRLALADSSDGEESINSSTHSCSISNDNEENGAETEARELVELVKTTLAPETTVISKIDRLLLDFFKEKITENKSSTLEEEKRTKYKQDFEVVGEWINGQPQEMFLGWEVKEKRSVYLKDMEKNVKWRNFDEEKEEVSLELEFDILSSLLHEALLDML